MSVDYPITLLSDVITILSHAARSSSEYVSMVTKVLQGDQGEYNSTKRFLFFKRQVLLNLCLGCLEVHLRDR